MLTVHLRRNWQQPESLYRHRKENNPHTFPDNFIENLPSDALIEHKGTKVTVKDYKKLVAEAAKTETKGK